MPDDPPLLQPASPRQDDTAGDVGALVDLGVIDQPPTPGPAPAPPPPGPAPGPDAGEQRQMLTTALADTGSELTADDQEAVEELAQLDPDTVETVTRWIRRGRPGTTPTPDKPAAGPRT